jgi:hypothetical protein
MVDFAAKHPTPPFSAGGSFAFRRGTHFQFMQSPWAEAFEPIKQTNFRYNSRLLQQILDRQARGE